MCAILKYIYIIFVSLPPRRFRAVVFDAVQGIMSNILYYTRFVMRFSAAAVLPNNGGELTLTEGELVPFFLSMPVHPAACATRIPRSRENGLLAV